MNASRKRSKWAVSAAAVAALALVLVPAASSTGLYTDASGDSGTAPDISGVTVAGDKASGQLLFRINGTNLASSPDLPTILFIDSDANPVTGDISSLGADYVFGVDDTSYGFWRWDGSNWFPTSYGTVRVTGNSRGIMISVNRSELGNASKFNFSAESLDVTSRASDAAPDDGMFNYAFEADGPEIVSVDLQTIPTAGPKAGKRFVVTPTALRLPPDGRMSPTPPKPESYTCRATIKGQPLAGSGTGTCTFRIPKKARGKQLKVVLTVTYQGVTKSFDFAFRVA